MQNPIQKFRQSSIAFEKLGILFRKLKTLTSSNCRRVEYFLLKFYTRFLLIIAYKRVFGIFFYLVQILSYLHIQNNLVSTQSLKLFSLITQDLSKIKNIPNIFLQALLSRKNLCKMLVKNIKPYGSWSLSKFSIFQTNSQFSTK